MRLCFCVNTKRMNIYIYPQHRTIAAPKTHPSCVFLFGLSELAFFGYFCGLPVGLVHMPKPVIAFVDHSVITGLAAFGTTMRSSKIFGSAWDVFQ